MDELLSINQYLTFTLEGECFAMDIGSVREILDTAAITRIPGMPAYMRGVINLRGRAVPVLDLRCRFGLDGREEIANSCIVIAEIREDGEEQVIGALVDSVQEVVELAPGAIEPPPRMGAAISTDYIRGMARHGDRFNIVLDATRVFSMHIGLVREPDEG